MIARPPIVTRAELLSSLTEACELEHGLACSYLFSAFSMKDQHDGDLTARQLVQTRKWAGQIYSIAAQEMLHLAQVWNLLAAIGGTPYYLRPNFPQRAKYYPLNVPLALERFSEKALLRFLEYERPQEPVARSLVPTSTVSTNETIGQLYDRIRSGLKHLASENLFLGERSRQASDDLVDFPDIIRVVDLDSAVAAVELLTTQGEGVPSDRDDCHFGLFYAVLEEMRLEQQAAAFEPARPVVDNPASRHRGDYGALNPTIIDDRFTADVMDLFDDIYQLMLRSLGYVFSFPSATKFRQQLSKLAIVLMPVVIKPLGEALTELPAGGATPGRTAGPAFAMSRHVVLPSEETAARALIAERLRDLVSRASKLSTDSRANTRLRKCIENLAALASRAP